LIKAGDEITVVLTGVKKFEKVVNKFSSRLPDKGFAGHVYDELSKDEKKLVDSLEPDKLKSGTSKEKFSHRWHFHFEHPTTKIKFYKEFEGRDGEAGWERCDVKYYTNEENVPWDNFAEFLRGLGAEDGDNKPIGSYIHIGDKFTAKVITSPKEDKYLHIDQGTLTPLFTVADTPDTPKEPTPAPDPTEGLTDKEKKLLEFLKGDGDGMAISDAMKKPGWAKVRKYVKSYTEDGKTIKIVE